jgi:hypothetical protein
MSEKELQGRIERIKRELASLGPLRPGTLYTRYSVCGKPGCKCSRKNKPVKHGPYHYLSYTFKARSYTEFVPATRLRVVKKEVSNYNTLMRLIKSLVDSSIKLARLHKSK